MEYRTSNKKMPSTTEKYEEHDLDHALYDFPDMHARPEMNRKSKRYYALLIIVSTAFVGLIVLIVGIENYKIANEAKLSNSIESSISDVDVTEDDDATIMWANPNLEKICTNRRIETESGLELCVKSCMPGACCFVNILHNLRSSSTQPELIPLIQYDQNDCSLDKRCVEFNHCMNLFQDKGIPNPPDDLHVLCSDKMEMCVEACEPGRCCRAVTDEPCYDTFPETCDKYKPCDILDVVHIKHDNEETNDHNTSFDPIKVTFTCTLDNISTNKGFKECSAACSIASCCFQKKCINVDEDFCLAYEPCTLLQVYERAEDGQLLLLQNNADDNILFSNETELKEEDKIESMKEFLENP